MRTPLFDVLDGLSARGLLDRVETIDVSDTSVSLRMAPPAKSAEEARVASKPIARDEEDPEGLKYASS